MQLHGFDTDALSLKFAKIIFYMLTNFNMCVLVLGMETHMFSRYICVSKDFWNLLINKELVCA